jgi:redox-sensitive bicupin YhaK (pirin superfamily)
MTMKKIQGVYRSDRGHWVGDGFPVRTLFDYTGFGKLLSPFLMLDYAGPKEFPASTKKRGVGTHPHRGFETVTIVYDGEVAHRDSAGGGGVIGPGDVQWMTAGAGILHEEFHSPAFTARGGLLHMVQLWVNLPAKDKMTPAAYQPILDRDIPAVDLPDGAGRVRVIAGQLSGARGPATTFSPMQVWDVTLHAGRQAEFSVPDGHSLAIVVLRGDAQVNGSALLHEAHLAVLWQEGSAFTLAAQGDGDVSLLVLAGEPLNEPIEGYGPFVMNTAQQIRDAVEDFNSGKFGKMPAQ